MKVIDAPIGQIRPYSNNPRKNDKAIDTVVKSIEQYGFQQPIVVDINNEIIVGHTRYRAALKLALKTVPIYIADKLTPEQVKAYRIMDNRSNQNSKWDDDLLFDELTLLLANNTIQDLSSETGFTESELNKMFDETEKDLSQFLNPARPKARTGDLWTLGNHKILCGSSTDSKDIKSLLDKDRIDMLWEDPPYGVAYQTANGINHTAEYNKAKNHIIKNDTLNEAALDEFLNEHLRQINSYVKPGAPIYWCHDIRFNHQFKQVLTANKFHTNDTLIWRKNSTSSWLTNYAKFYEPILYGWKEGKEHPWYGKGMQPNALQLNELQSMSQDELIEIINEFMPITNYQTVKKEARAIASLHPTVKPVKLILLHLINSSKVGDIVFDGFGGSGSTLIACEKSQRHARIIEVEEKFVDVTIARWQELTGQDAINQNGEKWNDIVVDTTSDIAMEAFFNLPSEVTINE
jgi:ParB/RepB/Spo0J family partition protein